MICSVVVDIQAKQLNRSFDYFIPPHLEPIVMIGSRVKVLFGRQLVMGFVVELKNKSSFKKTLKPITDVIDVFPPLNEEFVGLAKYIAEHNFSFYSTALQTMIPSALKIKYKKIAKKKEHVQLDGRIEALFGTKQEISLEGLLPEDLKLIYQSAKDGLLILDTKFKKNRNESMKEFFYVLDDSILTTSKQQKKVLDYLMEINEPIEKRLLLEDSGISSSVLKSMLSRGILGSYKEEYLCKEEEIKPVTYQPHFTSEQEKCYRDVLLNVSKTYVLHGVTGSGKTEVYMRLIEDALALSKSALMLVPEIALTPQITAIFKARFGSEVAIMHSRLSVFEKYSAWKKVINQEVKIVIGARSAIFAPLKDIGIIIIDEAHEKSYRQDNNPKYDAKEIAQIRSITHQCPLVLGSATPDVSDYFKALNGEYQLLTMAHRVYQQPLPPCEVVDMRCELKQGNKSVFSKSLQNALISTFAKKEQVILFLNRRGYSSFVMCRSCGEVVKCPHCDVSLTYHAYQNTLKCHHCGFQQPNVSSCNNCGSDRIRYVGSGTQKVMEEIETLIPQARVLRLDLDTTKKKSDYENAFHLFKNHEADILVGTQMISKGLDFENVTLVGIVNADLALHYPSYDAAMTSYSLIEQVSGRAGRGKKSGKVIIQTYQPNSFVIECASKHDYERFFNHEIQLRKLTQMPPFSQAIEIMVCSLDASRAFEEANNILRALTSIASKSDVLGPAEALPFRVADVFRFTIYIKIVEDTVLDKLKEVYPMYQTQKDVDIKITRM